MFLSDERVFNAVKRGHWNTVNSLIDSEGRELKNEWEHETIEHFREDGEQNNEHAVWKTQKLR